MFQTGQCLRSPTTQQVNRKRRRLLVAPVERQRSFPHCSVLPGMKLARRCNCAVPKTENKSAFILLDQQFAKDKPNCEHLLCLPMGHHCPLAHCGRMNRSLAFPHEVKQQSPLPRQSLLFFSCEKALEDHGDAYSCWRIPCRSIKNSRGTDPTTFDSFF